MTTENLDEKKLHPNQQVLDVHEPEKDELTAKDFEMLRKKKSINELSINKMLSYRSKATEKLGSEPAKDAKRKEGIRVSGMKVKAMLKKEDTQIEEAKDLPFDPPYKKAEPEKKTDKSGAVHTPMSRAKDLARQAMKKQMKEEFDLDITDEQADSLIENANLEEMFPGTPEYEKKYGKAPQDMKKGEKKKTAQGEMEKTGKGVVHRRKFSEMLEVYVDDGIKGLFESLNDKEEIIVEEPTNAEYTAELEKAKRKAAGTAGEEEKADVADAGAKAVKQVDEEIEQIDEISKATAKAYTIKKMNSVYAKKNPSKETVQKDLKGIGAAHARLTGATPTSEEVEQIEERELTDTEMEKREKLVKSMKKGVQGFKDRYGDRAKEVMYATATKIAKKD